MKIGFSANAFTNFSLIDAIQRISSAGYDGIEIVVDTPHAFLPLSNKQIEEIKHSLKIHKILVSNLNANTVTGWYSNGKNIEKFDLLPFKALHEKLGGIMTAHIAYPSVDKDISTFSKFWLGEILRHDIGFQGVIFSDDLSMKGANYSGDLEVKIQKSLSAGCNMILICNDRSAVYEALDFMELREISLSNKIYSLKATQIISWAELQKNPRRENIIKKLNLLNKEYS